MKRGEMIQKLIETYKTFSSWEEQCAYMLSVIEEAGMLPPPYYNRDYDDEPECDGMIPEWEPEDEA